MITTYSFGDGIATRRIGTDLGGICNELLRGSFLLHSLLLKLVILRAGFSSVPWHLVSETCLEEACSAGHDWIIIATNVDLA
jgi:hypothetical protein